ncbi:ABC transporter substrate-binding protein [Aureimonas jatrophae]|uniref:Putative spermidine/putrescine transport system substrate-binding protein n=1 Tax=Aureimonas jatrophae TaxID=1166073 RepID=A0A1H0F5M3_9HYPH|nr:ABC transporter substrate-binding protein [Aureimonas jatrophae]MBB3950167.1 putative spermidine/putrescine transport system substrate-binding protein [Aureimonas jatrophae]SDN89947.1 putative spermidine/putrescine transport system substrate-binding protein [Aureimonas jatrophae]
MIRTPLRLALAASAALALTAGAAQAKTLTISWWGFNGEKLDQIVIQPFKQQCGCDVVFETGNNADRLAKIRIRGGAGVDVAYFSDSFSQIGVTEGLFQEIDPAKVPNIAGLYDIAKAPQGPYGPAYTIGRVGIVTDTARVTTPVTSWDDLWREDMAASLTLPGITTTAGPMVVLKAGDHAGENAFDNPDAAFEAVDALKPNVVKTYNTGSEMINLFSTGEVSAAVAQDFTLGQIQAAVPTAAWADLKEGAIATVNTVNIPKGAAEPELALQYINFILSPEVQQKLAEQGVDAPAAKAVELTPEQARLWTYGADVVAKLQVLDYAKLNAAKNDWIDRWNEIFGG